MARWSAIRSLDTAPPFCCRIASSTAPTPARYVFYHFFLKQATSVDRIDVSRNSFYGCNSSVVSAVMCFVVCLSLYFRFISFLSIHLIYSSLLFLLCRFRFLPVMSLYVFPSLFRFYPRSPFHTFSPFAPCHCLYRISRSSSLSRQPQPPPLTTHHLPFFFP